MKSEKTLTVITTTYNRDYCLHQVYESLLRQTSNDFLWLIVDDGSTDNTRDLVERWKSENKIEIKYIYKPNGGMHTARNVAYENVHTALNVIIDSDDWMTDGAVEIITSYWKENGSDEYYGIITNNIDTNGNLIGSKLPDIKSSKHCTLIEKYQVSGDKKIILRSDLSRLFTFPEFEGEKFYPASYKYINLDQEYELLILNEATCVVDYNDDSMTYDKFAQYKANSKGFTHYRNAIIGLSSSPKRIIKEMIHYIAESKMSKSNRYIRNSSKPIYAAFCLPIGVIYYHYLQNTKKKY